MPISDLAGADRPNGLTGWASYVDTQYTQGSPFPVSANTDALLPNNALGGPRSQMPADVADLFADGQILGRNGDGIGAMVYFIAVPSVANQWLDVWVHIGGTVGVYGDGRLYIQTFTFPKGAGSERGVLYALPAAYTLGTWEQNGGDLYVRSNAALGIWGINTNVARSHKAR